MTIPLFRFPSVCRSRIGYVALGIITITAVTAALVGWGAYQWRLAQRELKAGDAQQALVRLQYCRWLWPRSSEVQLLAARATRLTGDLDGAERLLNACLKLSGGATQATQIEYMLLRVQSGEEEELSNALFELVESKHPESLMILETMAQAYMHHLHYGQAYACLSKWIEEAPENPQPHHWRGWVRERLNNASGAMIDYQKALELEPERSQVRLRMAEMFLEDKQPEKALPHLEHLLRKSPNSPMVRIRFGQCLFLQGRGAEARKHLEAGVKQAPDDPIALLHLGKLELEDDQPVQAEKWLRHALKVDKGDMESQYTLVAALQMQGRRSEAAAALAEYEVVKDLTDKANKMLRDEAENPSRSPEKSHEIGTALLRIGQERLGLYWLEQALERDPRHRPTHEVLAAHYSAKGDAGRAEFHSLELLKAARQRNAGDKSMTKSVP